MYQLISYAYAVQVSGRIGQFLRKGNEILLKPLKIKSYDCLMKDLNSSCQDGQNELGHDEHG